MPYLTLFTLIFSILSFPIHADTKKTWNSDWAFEREEEGISAECREHVSNIEQCRLTITVEESLTALTAINVDADNLANWMANLISVEKLPKSKGLHDYFLYITYDFPGAYNRYSVNHSTITQDETTKEVTLFFRTEKTKKKPKDLSLVKYESITGYWKFRPLDSGKTKVIYSYLSLPNGHVQSVLYPFYNTSSLNASFETIKDMLKEIKKDKYQNAKLDFVVEG